MTPLWQHVLFSVGLATALVAVTVGVILAGDWWDGRSQRRLQAGVAEARAKVGVLDRADS